jgi:integrase
MVERAARAAGFDIKIHPHMLRHTMSELLQFVIMAGFGALCFGCGYLVAFIVTRNKRRDEMIKRGAARYNWQTGKWEWGEPPKEPRMWKVE